MDNVDDAETFRETKEAMQLLGIYNESQRMMFRILAGILHLGNVQIGSNPKREDESQISVSFFIELSFCVFGLDFSGVNILQAWIRGSRGRSRIFFWPLPTTVGIIGAPLTL